MKLSKSEVKRLKRRGVFKEISEEEAQKKWEEGETIVVVDDRGNILPSSMPPNQIKGLNKKIIPDEEGSKE